MLFYLTSQIKTFLDLITRYNIWIHMDYNMVKELAAITIVGNVPKSKSTTLLHCLLPPHWISCTLDWWFHHMFVKLQFRHQILSIELVLSLILRQYIPMHRHLHQHQWTPTITILTSYYRKQITSSRGRKSNKEINILLSCHLLRAPQNSGNAWTSWLLYYVMKGIHRQVKQSLVNGTEMIT